MIKSWLTTTKKQQVNFTVFQNFHIQTHRSTPESKEKYRAKIT